MKDGRSRTAISQELTQAALRTEPEYGPVCERLQNPGLVRLLHAAIGMCTESGEFLGIVKKYIYYGQTFNRVDAIKEIGDSTWYERIGCDELQIMFLDMIQANIDKLTIRFPEKFIEELAINRNELKEAVTIPAVGSPASPEVEEALRRVPKIDVVGVPLDNGLGKATVETR